MEGLTRLIDRVVELGEFLDFRFGKEEFVVILQFVVNTKNIGDGCSDNLWSMKAILRGLELMSGLRLDFLKAHLWY